MPKTVRAPTVSEKQKFIEAVAYGFPPEQAAKFCKLPLTAFDAIETTDADFALQIEEARAAGDSSLELALHRSMRAGIERGDKFAIKMGLDLLKTRGFVTELRDPEAASIPSQSQSGGMMIGLDMDAMIKGLLEAPGD